MFLLFSLLGKLTNPDIYFTVHNFFYFLNSDKLSQDPLIQFSQSLHQIIGICSSMTDLDLFFDSSRDVAMATNFMAKFGYMRSFGRAAFENG